MSSIDWPEGFQDLVQFPGLRRIFALPGSSQGDPEVRLRDHKEGNNYHTDQKSGRDQQKKPDFIGPDHRYTLPEVEVLPQDSAIFVPEN